MLAVRGGCLLVRICVYVCVHVYVYVHVYAYVYVYVYPLTSPERRACWSIPLRSFLPQVSEIRTVALKGSQAQDMRLEDSREPRTVSKTD